MLKNFPPKYYIIFSDHPESKYHKNRIISGLRVALTLLMEEFDINILLLQQSVALADKNRINSKTENEDSDDINFTPYELLEGLISFGATIMTCKSSLSMADMKKDDLVEGVEIYTLHTALMKMTECDKTLTF